MIVFVIFIVAFLSFLLGFFEYPCTSLYNRKVFESIMEISFLR